MKRQSSPTRVTPAAALGAGVHASHPRGCGCARRSQGACRSPRYFRSCGTSPIDGEGEDHRALADLGPAGDDGVALDHHPGRRAVTFGADAPRTARPRRPRRSPRRARRRRRGGCARRDGSDMAAQAFGRSIIAVNSASQASSPSTMARPSNFQTLPPPRFVATSQCEHVARHRPCGGTSPRRSP